MERNASTRDDIVKKEQNIGNTIFKICDVQPIYKKSYEGKNGKILQD